MLYIGVFLKEFIIKSIQDKYKIVRNGMYQVSTVTLQDIYK